MRELWRRLRHGGTRERGLDEEVQFHINQQTEKYVRAGMSRDEARRKALTRFGGVESTKEQTRDEFRPAFLDDFSRDLRYGVRLLFRSKVFSIVAILTLGLGIGAATAVFSVVNGVLLRPLPYPDPDRIVRLHQVDKNGRRNNNVSEPNFDDWKSGTRSFTAMAEMSAAPQPVSLNGDAIMVTGALVSREFFDVMAVRPIVGRGFLPEEQHVGATPTAIVSDRLWRTRFNAAALDSITLRVESTNYVVVGVMPPGFNYPARQRLLVSARAVAAADVANSTQLPGGCESRADVDRGCRRTRAQRSITGAQTASRRRDVDVRRSGRAAP